jgi:hypothetical protein
MTDTHPIVSDYYIEIVRVIGKQLGEPAEGLKDHLSAKRIGLFIGTLIVSISASLLLIFAFRSINNSWILGGSFLIGIILASNLYTLMTIDKSPKNIAKSWLFHIIKTLAFLIFFFPLASLKDTYDLMMQYSLIGQLIIFGIVLVIFLASLQILSSMITDLISRIFLHLSIGFTVRATIGFPINEVICEVFELIKSEGKAGRTEKDLNYLRDSAQAMIDSSYTRVLPWISLLAILALPSVLGIKAQIANNLGEVIASNIFQFAGSLIIIFVFMAIMNISHRTYLDVALIQAISRYRSQLSEYYVLNLFGFEVKVRKHRSQ